MYSLAVLLVALAAIDLSHGTSISYMYEDIVSKTKVELSPVHIKASLNEIFVLVSPIVNCQNAQYHLRKPNGDVLRTEMSIPNKFSFYNTNTQLDSEDTDETDVVIKYINKNIKAMYPRQMYKAFNLANDGAEGTGDFIAHEESKMNKNDFIIGPLLEEDHGNWVLSIYCRDIDGEWVEMFQVITIEIIATAEMSPSATVQINKGSAFKLSFRYPVKDIETCELTVPSRDADRFFDRIPIELDKCGYVVPNITKRDQGQWIIIGVGRIVYQGVVNLKVRDPDENDDEEIVY